MTIRKATPDDAARIADIWNGIIRDPVITFTTEEKTPQSILELMETQPVLVADIGNQVSGFVTYGVFRAGPGYRHTGEVIIHLAPSARGQGIGRNLMQTLLDQARECEIHAMVAGVSAENPAAIRFHQALGFTEVARMPEVGRKAGRWLDLILLQKLLNT
jgi:phosphinothricin acetyltransferase